MWVNRLTVFAGLGCLLVYSGAALAQGMPQGAQAGDALQPLATVRATAERAVRGVLDPNASGVELTAATLDPRLRLAACARFESHVQPPRGTQSRVLARVSCTNGASWSVNVPVEIRRTQRVLVVRRALARGETIGAADVEAQTRELPGLASPYVTRIEDLAGRLTRRPIPAGTLLSADAMSAALLIHRGQEVTLTASYNGLEVRAPGRALADAAALQRVRVQNLLSLKIVEGVADSEGVVRITH